MHILQYLFAGINLLEHCIDVILCISVVQIQASTHSNTHAFSFETHLLALSQSLLNLESIVHQSLIKKYCGGSTEYEH